MTFTKWIDPTLEIITCILLQQQGCLFFFVKMFLLRRHKKTIQQPRAPSVISPKHQVASNFLDTHYMFHCRFFWWAEQYYMFIRCPLFIVLRNWKTNCETKQIDSLQAFYYLRNTCVFFIQTIWSVPLHRQELTLEHCLLVQSENLYTCHPVSGDAPWCSTKLLPKPIRSTEKPSVLLFSPLWTVKCPVLIKLLTLHINAPAAVIYKLAAASCFSLG